MKKYFGNFDSIEDVHGWAPETLLDEEVIFASYDTPDYDGYAACYYKRDGKLYEVHDSHCSCYGLDNWEPEETSFEAVLMRTDLEPEMRALLEAAR